MAGKYGPKPTDPEFDKLHIRPAAFLHYPKTWDIVALKCGHDTDVPVVQHFSVLGGQKRYNNRPLQSYYLSNGRTLTLTTDKMEMQVWHKLVGKKNIAFPTIYDAFNVHLPKGQLFAILHETLTIPVPKDWTAFVQAFFQWRAQSSTSLKPAQPSDLEHFLTWCYALEDKSHKDPAVERALGWKEAKARRKGHDARRDAITKDSQLGHKVEWAENALRFLKKCGIAFEDFDPSNLAKSPHGVVITNLAESRSKGHSGGGRVGSISSPTPKPVKLSPKASPREVDFGPHHGGAPAPIDFGDS